MDALSSVSQSATRDHSDHLGRSANMQISFLPPNDPKCVGFFFFKSLCQTPQIFKSKRSSQNVPMFS